MKLANFIVYAMSIIGIFILIGAVGTSDYMVEIGEYYPLSETIKLFGLAFLFEVPLIVKEVL